MKKTYDFVPENMSMETYGKIYSPNEKISGQTENVMLMGQGEPLINKDIPVMVKMAKDAEIAERVEIISNGSLLDKTMSDRLIEAGLDTLRISLQGLNSKKYKDICGANINFDDFMDNIRYFYAHKNNTNLFVKIMDVCLEEGEEEKFYRLFEDCSDRMYIEKMLPAYDGVEITKNMKVEYDRYGRKHEKRNVCPLPFYMLGIFPNGDVEPCDTIYKPIVLGNINNSELIDMWNGEKLREFWKLQLKGNRLQNDKCKVCCAPDDVSHPEDVLDDDVEEILKRLETMESNI